MSHTKDLSYKSEPNSNDEIDENDEEYNDHNNDKDSGGGRNETIVKKNRKCMKRLAVKLLKRANSFQSSIILNRRRAQAQQRRQHSPDYFVQRMLSWTTLMDFAPAELIMNEILQVIQWNDSNECPVRTPPPATDSSPPQTHAISVNQWKSALKDHDWLWHFRMHKNVFEWLCNQLAHSIEPINDVGAEMQIALAIYTLASGDNENIVAMRFNTTKENVQLALTEFMAAFLMQLGRNLLIMPSTDEEYDEIRMEFGNNTAMPPLVLGALGIAKIPFAVPNTIPTIDPTDDGNNLKLEMIVDERLLIRYLNLFIEPMTSGADLPECIAQLKPVRYFDRDVQCYLVGSNELYTLRPWLMVPYPEDDELHMHSFNNACQNVLAYSSVCVSRLFARWKVLNRKLNVDMSTWRTIVTVCCALHNLVEEFEQPYLQEWNCDPIDTTLNLMSTVGVTDSATEGLRDFLAQSIQMN